MRKLLRSTAICGFLLLLMGAFNNFSPLTELNQQIESILPQPKKSYVQINGKFFEKNASGVYTIDGVPTFAKPGSKKGTAKAETKHSLGPPIDPMTLKDAMGLTKDDDFFRPATDESSSQ